MDEVLVIGAGMAGLSCARVLAEAGLHVTILETSDRVGGRMRTVLDGDAVVELGAEFVHGRPHELWDLIAEAGLETYERTGEFFELREGRLQPMEQDEEEALEELKDYTGPDCSFTEYVSRLKLSDEEHEAETGYVEGFNAADASEASVLALGRQQQAEDAIEGDRMWRLVDGYEALTKYLRGKVEAAGGKFVFGTKVVQVDRQDDGVHVEDKTSHVFSAHKVVVTVPLAVLQRAVIGFNPAPSWLKPALDLMRMGQVCRFTLVFKTRLWPEPMSFLMTPELPPRVWWTARPSANHTLTGWVGGPKSDELLALPADALREHAILTAAKALTLDESMLRAELIGFYTHDWQSDETTGGAYSWVAVGGIEASAKLSEPLDDVLFFAGEHTDTTGHWGTVQRRAAVRFEGGGAGFELSQGRVASELCRAETQQKVDSGILDCI